MVLNINFPRYFISEVKILYLIKNSKLLLKGYGCHNPNSEKCRNCSLQSFKKGSLLDIDINEVKKNKSIDCAEMSNLFFSLKFEVENIDGIRLS
ncbi:hypothetical protein [uncultured Ilyobacter sp.]|uniref:hypothetical protein n=1 Tax=uncultured Ilyobacter sp. TaxID=544433 RepID=UPI0029C8FB29|nr:hypothetical protein [uncultured Ilyobacter sp.]